jgi:acetyl-CoA acetyltransferase
MTWPDSCGVAIAGVGFSEIHRRSQRSLGAYAVAACRAALADCGLTFADIDGLATYPTAPFSGAANLDGEDVITPEFFLSHKQTGEISWYSQAGAGLVVAAVRDAVNALLAGACRYVLVWRAMYVPPGVYGRGASGPVNGDAQFSAPHGLMSPLQWHALAYQRYRHRYGMYREAMATLAVNSRRNANLNTHAIFADRALSVEDYLSARIISDPLCLYDCDVPVTACAAIVLTTAERARHLRQPSVQIAAIAHQSVVRPPKLHYALHDHIESGAPLAQALWRQSGLGPADMSVAQLYDGFSPSVLYWLEAAGFCDRGEAWSYIQDGRIALTGDLPVNTFGGSLSQGRLHGMGHLVEAVLQLRGDAGARQIRDANAVCVLDGSPLLRGAGLVLTKET